MAGPIIGIDFGTTNSCAAVCDAKGNVKLIPYRGGEYTIPSIYAIDEKGNELVGHEAKRQWQLNPKNTIYGAKRLIGTSPDSELVGEMRKHVSYEIRAGTNNDIVIPVAGRVMTLQQIVGKILAKIRDVATQSLGVQVDRAVVTTPAYFNDRQRQAVHDAGKDVGLHILRIINEPTAAALAYGARKATNQTVAIYDLGGGTFDISVIEIRDRVFEVKSTGGDIFLGGIDFDNALIEYILAEFQAQHGISLATDQVAMQRIRDTAERAKIDLSERSDVAVRIPFITMSDTGKPLDVNLTIRRDDFEMLTEHYVVRTFDTVARVIDDAGLTPESIDEVLLVGGQTRMPMIQRRIEDFFAKSPSKGVHPDEAVAVGAALYAWSLEERSNLKLQLLDVLPMAIGIEGAQGSLHILFERNSPVPNRRAFTFTTHQDNQKDLAMRLYQGDRPNCLENALLGEFTFNGLSLGPAGSVRVEVVFDVSSEGIISLDARDLHTGASMRQTVRFRTATA